MPNLSGRVPPPLFYLFIYFDLFYFDRNVSLLCSGVTAYDLDWEWVTHRVVANVLTTSHHQEARLS